VRANEHSSMNISLVSVSLSVSEHELSRRFNSIVGRGCRLWPSRSPDIGHLEGEVERNSTEVMFDTKGQTAESIF
jgi:hypothetical protein